MRRYPAKSRSYCEGSFPAAVGAAVLAALVSAGCASTQSEQAAHDPRLAGPPHQVARSEAPLEMEDDGLPVQAPPRRRERSEPDDPSEPFSPNYGTRPPVARTADAPLRPEPAAASASWLRNTQVTVAADEAEARIVSAAARSVLRP